MFSNPASRRRFRSIVGPLFLGATALVAMAAPRSSEAADAPPQEQSPASQPAPSAAEETAPIDKPVVGKNYVILPITTNLQRAKGKAYEKAKFFVLINGSALFNEDDTVLNMAPLGLQTLRETMAAQLRAGVRGDTVIQIAWPMPLPRPKGVDSASSALESLLRASWGFPGAVHMEVVLHNHDWKYANAWDSLVADLTKPPPEGVIQEEAGIGDDQVKLYAIRTPLSQYLFGSGDGDCVIHIIPPIEEAKASAVLTMQQRLPQLNLKRKDFVWFLATWKDCAAANAVRDDFYGEHVWRDLLGFKSCGRMARN